MSITDELREWSHGFRGSWHRYAEELLDIADRIDEQFNSICQQQEDVLQSTIDRMVENYVELPVDADGEPIHVGDFVEGHNPRTNVKIAGEVECVVFGKHETYIRIEAGVRFMECSPANARLRHYHAPTVEDVLHDYLKAHEELGDRDYCVGDDARAAWDKARAKLDAEFAERLQLKEEQ